MGLKKTAKPTEPLSEKNFREFAQAVIQKYGEKGMIVDAMLWGGIIAHYERALAEVKPAAI